MHWRYVVVHPRWRKVVPAGENPTPKPGIKNRQFTLAALGGAMRSAAASPQPGAQNDILLTTSAKLTLKCVLQRFRSFKRIQLRCLILSVRIQFRLEAFDAKNCRVGYFWSLGEWRNGKRAWLRTTWGNPCRFDSCLAHHLNDITDS